MIIAQALRSDELVQISFHQRLNDVAVTRVKDKGLQRCHYRWENAQKASIITIKQSPQGTKKMTESLALNIYRQHKRGFHTA